MQNTDQPKTIKPLNQRSDLKHLQENFKIKKAPKKIGAFISL
jgi:hypothetical protein